MTSSDKQIDETLYQPISWVRSGDYHDISYDTAEGIAKITICRPEVRNAFRPQTLFELSHAFVEARDDPDVGVIVLTKTTAVDLGPTVRCNCYCPAAVDTPMVSKYFETAEDPDAIIRALVGSHIIPRLGKPEEIARLVCFLGSDEASWITGQSFIIDGGSLAWRGTNA